MHESLSFFSFITSYPLLHATHTDPTQSSSQKTTQHASQFQNSFRKNKKKGGLRKIISQPSLPWFFLVLPPLTEALAHRHNTTTTTTTSQPSP